MTLLRMLAFRPAGAPEEARTVPAALPQGGAAAAAPVPDGIPTPAGGPVAATGEGGAWAAIVAQLELTGAARQLATHCVFLGRQGAVVRLGLDSRHQLVRTSATEDKLAHALSRHFGTTVRLEFQAGAAAGGETPAQAQRRASEAELTAARRAFDEDAGVKGLRERFGAAVLPETVRPVK
jgi:DNA polymerase-3 subunit gamma/tau